MCMTVCGYVHVSVVPTEAKRGHQIPLELELQMVMCAGKQIQAHKRHTCF